MKDVYLVSMVRVTVPENASERLEQVLAFMSQHCSDATLASVAAHFNFHPNTVSGLIKRETGKSFGETLREIRMERALTLLDAREIPVAQVARLCGYENPSNFYRVFKETFGMTPRVYMAQRDKELAAAGKQGTAEAGLVEDAFEQEPSSRGQASDDADLDVRSVPVALSTPVITGIDGTPLPRVRVSARDGQGRIRGGVALASAVATRQGSATLGARDADAPRVSDLPEGVDLDVLGNELER